MIILCLINSKLYRNLACRLDFYAPYAKETIEEKILRMTTQKRKKEIIFHFLYRLLMSRGKMNKLNRNRI